MYFTRICTIQQINDNMCMDQSHWLGSFEDFPRAGECMLNLFIMSLNCCALRNKICFADDVEAQRMIETFRVLLPSFAPNCCALWGERED